MLDEKKILIKKLKYRSRYMGCKENDLLFGNFAENNLHNFSLDGLKLYKESMKNDDETLLSWIYKPKLVPKKFHTIINKIRKYKI